ncbi:MAG: hypothetical protein RRA35_14370 [Desulfomonilia bacterium]|nr:hypothetical protein [Desulfomonilia bacterium]
MKNVLTTLYNADGKETPGEILFFRIFELIMVGWALRFGWEWGLYIPYITDIVLPLGIARFIDISFMFENSLSVLNAVLMTGAAIVGILRMHRLAYPVLIVLFHIQYVSRYSLGEISHGSNVVGLSILALAVGFAAFKTEKEARRFTLGTIVFFLGLGYTTAAASKLIASGPAWVDGAHMWMWIQERTVDVFSKTGDIHLTVLQQWVLEHHVLATAILTFGLLTELAGVLVWLPRFRPVVMTLLFMMHVGIFLSMQISFPANDAILLLLAYPWSKGLDRLITSFNLERSLLIDRCCSTG